MPPNGERLPLTGAGLTLVLIGLGLILVVLIVRPLRKRVRGEVDSDGSSMK